MNNILLILANVMISLYVPYEVCRLIIRQYEKESERRRIGLGAYDSIIRAFNIQWVVRGAKFIAAIRKTISGLVFGSFLFGLTIGLLGGYGWALIFWFCELLVIGLVIDMLGKFKKKDELWPVGY